MKVLPGQLTKLRKQQYDAYHKDEPGAWFGEVTAIIAALQVPREEGVLSINLANGSPVAFDANGNAVQLMKKEKRSVVALDAEGNEIRNVEEIEVFDQYATSSHRGWHQSILDRLVPGCVPCAGTVFGARIGAGIMVAVGRGDSAKTPFAHALGELVGAEEGYEVVRLGEPLSGYNTDLEEATSNIVKAVLTSRVIVIDSIKDILGNAGGNATSSGLSRGAFQFISDLGTIAASRGCLIIVPVNPSSSDPKIEQLMIEVSKSNATMVAIGDQQGWEILSRTGEGLIRTRTQIGYKFNDKTLLMELHAGWSDQGKETKVKTTALQTSISNDEFEQIVSRLSRV